MFVSPDDRFACVSMESYHPNNAGTVSYAQGKNDESHFRALAETAGGGRLGMVSAIPAATTTVVDFRGNEHYSTPGNGWGASVVVCYRVTLGPSMPHPVPLETVTC
ncbi:hypothetical protein SRB17_67330 [Streptomyces sp. RB17]|uniref:hypothetical protein n=1 Tax=Streptomyces sp. RB17 TaxID=2585197 RepID=UPI001295DBF3|nr:hypothetical protein [Streptomyces sp. RB17]MQY38720.1 hypothetical protein [Streptomyces sp. RB17]